MSTGRSVTTASARDRLLAAADELFYERGHPHRRDRPDHREGGRRQSHALSDLREQGGPDPGLSPRPSGGPPGADQRGAGRPRVAPGANPWRCSMSLSRLCQEPNFHGCAFVERGGRVASPGAPRSRSPEESRAWNRELFTGLARAAGAADPEQLSRQLVQLYDGAVVVGADGFRLHCPANRPRHRRPPGRRRSHERARDRLGSDQADQVIFSVGSLPVPRAQGIQKFSTSAGALPALKVMLSGEAQG